MMVEGPLVWRGKMKSKETTEMISLLYIYALENSEESELLFTEPPPPANPENAEVDLAKRESQREPLLTWSVSRHWPADGNAPPTPPSYTCRLKWGRCSVQDRNLHVFHIHRGFSLTRQRETNSWRQIYRHHHKSSDVEIEYTFIVDLSSRTRRAQSLGVMGGRLLYKRGAGPSAKTDGGAPSLRMQRTTRKERAAGVVPAFTLLQKKKKKPQKLINI